MVIDFHCHASIGPEPVRRYMVRAREAGIDRTVMFAPHRTDYSRTNRLVEQLVGQAPDRLVGLVFIHPVRDRGRVDRIVSEAILSGQFVGIKVHGSESELGPEVCQAAARHGVPILMDVFGKPELIEPLVKRFPTVAFVVAHLGSFADDWAAQKRTIQLLTRYANVYADTSGVRRFDALRFAIESAGPGKILFGSDGPLLHPELELHKIRLLKLPAAEEALVLGGNAHRLLYPSRHFESSINAKSPKIFKGN